MKTKERYQRFADELMALCKKHEIFIAGTRNDKNKHAEINLIDKSDPVATALVTLIYVSGDKVLVSNKKQRKNKK